MNVNPEIYEKFPAYIRKSKNIHICKHFIVISDLKRRKMHFVKYWYDEKEDIVKFDINNNKILSRLFIE